MAPSMMQIVIAILLVVIAVGLVFAARKFMGAGSTWRMRRMMMRVGLDPDIGNYGDPKMESIMQAARKTCGRCQSESVCEQWLEDQEGGENTFCPNAELFRELTKTTL